jgi:naphthalene 1,2-dioxygenase system ferredoxin subunit
MTNNAGRWCRAADQAEVPEEDPLGVEVEGIPIALYRVDGAFHATSDVCTHGQALLSDGLLVGCTIECPLHNGRFDVRTGKALTSPVEIDLQVYPVRLEGDEIQVLLPG